MEKEVFYTLFVAFAGIVAVVQGYSGGAGTGACTSMIPGHGPGGQTGVSPYTVTASTTTPTAGGTVDVTISGSTFKGFLIQAREVGSDTASGSWINIPANAQKRCPGDIAVTHTGPEAKTSITLTWQAPSPLPSSDIEFVATVVQGFSIFWVQLKPGSPASPTTTPGPPTPSPPSTTPPTQPDISIDLADCGTDKSCYRSPDGCTTAECDFIVTWKKGASDKVDFEMSAKSSGYVAVGFNTDQKMDQASVTACVIQDSGLVGVSQYYNQGYSSIRVSDDQLGLSNTVGAHVGDSVTCTFTRDVTVTPSNNQVKDLNEDVYLIVAVGPSVGGLVSRHSSTPTISTSQENPSSGEAVALGGGAVVSLLEQIHAILMISAWMFCASLGILLARYYKGSWAENSLCGEKVWFALHRFLMVTNLFLTIGAFVVIFIDAKRWSSWGVASQDAHPIIGTIVTGLVLINPLMAACRPHPDEPKRPIFNWAHWAVGTAGHILATVNIFLGMNLPSAKSFTPRLAMWLLVAFYVVHVVVEIVLEVEKCRSTKSQEQQFELTNINEPKGGSTNTQKEGSFLKTVIGLYILIALGLWIAVIVLLII